jgi:hypothetical protein
MPISWPFVTFWSIRIILSLKITFRVPSVTHRRDENAVRLPARQRILRRSHFCRARCKRDNPVGHPPTGRERSSTTRAPAHPWAEGIFVELAASEIIPSVTHRRDENAVSHGNRQSAFAVATRSRPCGSRQNWSSRRSSRDQVEGKSNPPARMVDG